MSISFYDMLTTAIFPAGAGYGNGVPFGQAPIDTANRLGWSGCGARPSTLRGRLS